MAGSNRITILNDMLHASVEAGIMDLASMAIEQGATLHTLKDDDRCVIKSAIKNNSLSMRDMLLSKGAVVSIDALVFGVGYKRINKSNITDELVKSLVAHVNFADDVVFIHLLIAVVVKSDIEIYNEIERHFDIKKTLRTRKYWLGSLFDYVREDSYFLFAFLDDLPASSFDFKGEMKKETLVKKRLLSNRCFKTLDYLNKRGVFEQGLSFGDEYKANASDIDEMAKLGYSVTCAYSLDIIMDGMFSTNASLYFNKDRRENTRALIHYLEDAPSANNNAMNTIVIKIGEFMGHCGDTDIMNLLRYMLRSFYDKGYFNGVTIPFKVLAAQSVLAQRSESKDTSPAPLMILLLSEPVLKEALFSRKIMFTDESIDDLCLDIDTCTTWLNQYSPISPVLQTAIDKIKKGDTKNHHYTFKLIETQLERLPENERSAYLSKEWDNVNVKYNNDSFVSIMDDMHDILRSVKDGANAHREIGGKWSWHIFVCPDDLLADHFSDTGNKTIWKSLCRMKNKTPLFYLERLPESSPSRGVLLELMAE